MRYSRRDLLAFAAQAPLFGAASGALRWLPGGDDRCLVVLELEGGNDGLNTLIPVDDPVYARVRPTLASVRKGALPVAAGFALHPALAPLHALMQQGKAAAIHGVGYPQPDRSHFKSRDIWHTGDPAFERETATTTGWLGRAADALAERGAAVPGISVGSLQVPLALRSRHVVVPSLQRIEDYQLLGDPAAGRIASEGEGGAAFVAEVARAAIAASERLRTALAAYRSKAEYPDDDLGRKLQLLAKLVVSGFGTRLFHLGFGGFDTHARQAPAQDALLRMVGNGLAALLRDLDGHQALGRVRILVHSEFGRRLAENQSLGTDHGAAAPVFLLGEHFAAPLQGTPPSLRDLDDGDLKFTCDFRSVHAELLAWIGLKPAAAPDRPASGR